MEKKKFSIELPKGGMSDLAKQTISKPHQEPLADAKSGNASSTILMTSRTYQNMVNVSGS